MHVISRAKSNHLRILWRMGCGVRKAARLAHVHRDTAMRHRRAWIREQLQLAYDLLWDRDGQGCDAITAMLPDKDVMAMLDAWEDDQMGDTPKSEWH